MQRNNPILINVPHSATYIPPTEEKYFTTPDIGHEINVMTDHYCDDLYDTGDRMIRFPISRLVCDPERFRDDSEEIMASIGMGAIYSSCSDGSELKEISPKHKERLLSRYYDRYHNRFEREVEKKLQKHGKCLIIDGHSFYDEPLPYEFDQYRDRPDICIGTDEYHTPDRVVEMLCSYFRGRGYSVELNRPFAGCIVPIRYYRSDRRVKSVMIEINRRIYMDHSLAKTCGYMRIKQDVAAAVRLLEKCI
ncbi:MAG: N-formylglutamate amidohydrolase [Lachnospiraceae bacterium]|nr:N-formylglutamate amidohydrolase [Lachnospiraceae bacterium]